MKLVEDEEIAVPDSNAVFLGIAAGNYAQADTNYWRYLTVLGDRPRARAEETHLARLAQHRKETYSDLVTWVLVVEAERVHAGATVDEDARAATIVRLVKNGGGD